MFKITSTTSTSNFEYTDKIAVKGYFNKDVDNNKVTSINADCYRIDEQGQIAQSFGRFSGSPDIQTGEFDYDLSKMSRSDSNLVWDAIEAIEPQILPVDEE